MAEEQYLVAYFNGSGLTLRDATFLVTTDKEWREAEKVHRDYKRARKDLEEPKVDNPDWWSAQAQIQRFEKGQAFQVLKGSAAKLSNYENNQKEKLQRSLKAGSLVAEGYKSADPSSLTPIPCDIWKLLTKIDF